LLFSVSGVQRFSGRLQGREFFARPGTDIALGKSSPSLASHREKRLSRKRKRAKKVFSAGAFHPEKEKIYEYRLLFIQRYDILCIT
jgi:hypothetical protein